MKKKRLLTGALALSILLSAQTFCVQASEISQVEVEIPGLQQDYRFVLANDQHILVDDEEVLPEKKEDLAARIGLFTSNEGVPSAQAWPGLVAEINDLAPDGVVLIGDMLDFYSENNFELFRESADLLTAPCMYLRADHDLGLWYHDTISKEERDAKEKEYDGCSPVMTMEFEDFVLVGVNNNTSPLTKDGLEQLKEIWAMGKPILLFLHVPLKSKIDDALADASKEVWQDRALLWGTNCYYEPDETTQKFLDMVTAPDSPVKAIFSGHLHFAFEDEVREGIPQYVLDASYKGNYTILTVRRK